MNLKVQKEGGASLVALPAKIDEGCADAFRDLPASVGADVVFDMQAISYMNSLGIGGFASMLRNLPQGTKVRFRRCPPVFVNAFNMIAGLSEHGRIESLYIPLVCSECDESASVLETTSDLKARGGRAAAHECAHCKHVMQPELDEEDYLAFLSVA